MKLKLDNKKSFVPGDKGSWVPRVFHRSSKGRRDPRYLIKCGCCDKSVEIYYDNDSLEINGVNASIEDWQKILLPLLNK